jgi:superfamily II DNA or RNA helicase
MGRPAHRRSAGHRPRSNRDKPLSGRPDPEFETLSLRLVSTHESALLDLDRLGSRFCLIVFDECHHLPGPAYGLSATYTIAPLRLGLTAPPVRREMAYTHLDI